MLRSSAYDLERMKFAHMSHRGRCAIIIQIYRIALQANWNYCGPDRRASTNHIHARGNQCCHLLPCFRYLLGVSGPDVTPELGEARPVFRSP
jgi:hypothetical protein